MGNGGSQDQMWNRNFWAGSSASLAAGPSLIFREDAIDGMFQTLLPGPRIDAEVGF